MLEAVGFDLSVGGQGRVRTFSTEWADGIEHTENASTDIHRLFCRVPFYILGVNGLVQKFG